MIARERLSCLYGSSLLSAIDGESRTKEPEEVPRGRAEEFNGPQTVRQVN